MRVRILAAASSNTIWIKNWEEEVIFLLEDQEEIEEKRKVDEEKQLPTSQVEQQSPLEAAHQNDEQGSKADEGRNQHTNSSEFFLPTAVNSPSCTDCTGEELENCEMEEKVEQESKMEQFEKDKVFFWRPWEGGCFGGGDEEKTSDTQTESSVWRGGTGGRNIITNYSLPPTSPSSVCPFKSVRECSGNESVGKMLGSEERGKEHLAQMEGEMGTLTTLRSFLCLQHLLPAWPVLVGWVEY